MFFAVSSYLRGIADKLLFVCYHESLFVELASISFDESLVLCFSCRPLCFQNGEIDSLLAEASDVVERRAEALERQSALRSALRILDEAQQFSF